MVQSISAPQQVMANAGGYTGDPSFAQSPASQPQIPPHTTSVCFILYMLLLLGYKYD